MQTAITQLLDQLAGLLGPLSPFTKAIVPAALGVADVLVNLAVTGSLNGTDLVTAGGALVLALVVYLLPNKAPATK